jgi:hypothetical protein
MSTKRTLSLTACGLVGYLVGWGRGSRWTRVVLTDFDGRATRSAPHWS